MCDQDDSHFTDTPSSANSENGSFLTYLGVVLDAIGKAFKATSFINRSVTGINPTNYYCFHDACDAVNMAERHRKEIIKNHKGKGTGLDDYKNDLMCFGQFIIDCQRSKGQIFNED